MTVTDAGGRTVFESGAPRPDGSIAGNDNDADPARYEPHYTLIDDPGQVQIYEPILGDAGGQVTTGLLSASRYLKDSRLLPAGFDKETAHADIAVHGGARSDADFLGGGDRVRYRVPAADAQGPVTVQVRLWYQPIGFRWAMNLAPYQATEPQRFVGYYREMSASAGLVLAEASGRCVAGRLDGS